LDKTSKIIKSNFIIYSPLIRGVGYPPSGPGRATQSQGRKGKKLHWQQHSLSSSSQVPTWHSVSTELGYENHDGIYPNFTYHIPPLNTPIITEHNKFCTGYYMHMGPCWQHCGIVLMPCAVGNASRVSLEPYPSYITYVLGCMVGPSGPPRCHGSNRDFIMGNLALKYLIQEMLTA